MTPVHGDNIAREMRNIYLVGFSGTGKSHSGRLAASKLTWEFVDTDQLVERRTGKAVPQIFAEDGEGRFREAESAVLAEVAAQQGRVVSTGGGVPVNGSNRDLMKRTGLVIRLKASPETIHTRVARGEGARGRALRPLLGGDAPVERIRQLLEEREPAYAEADVTIDTDGKEPRDVAEEIVETWRNFSKHAASAIVGTGALDRGKAGVGMDQADHSDKNLAAVVKTSQGEYRAIVGQGVIETIGREMAAAGLKGRAHIIADQALFPVGVRRCQEALEAGGFESHVLAIPSGEQAKTLDTARSAYQWLAERRAERGDTIVALGGGVTGDLAGFVAATWLRGVPFVQAPTTLAAMVDASIGGKVAVNLPAGKNLVGAFHQPCLVLAEVDYLKTLPQRELASGWAEAIKHGLILDAGLLNTLDASAGEALSMTGDVAVEAVRRSVAIKAEVVSADEYETGDVRVLLNYGHTVGHALEAVTGYGRYLHGEAVSIGMMAAAGIAQRLGMVSRELVDRQRAVLERYGLPVRTSGVSIETVLAATRSDKKVRGGAVRWVLLTGAGSATTRRDVPERVVREALTDVLG